MDAGEVQSGPLQGARAQVGDEDVRVLQQTHHGVASAGLGDVQHYAPLAAVLELEDRVAFKVGGGGEGVPCRIAAAALDLDHVRAPVGHDHGGAGPGDIGGELDDLQSLQQHDLLHDRFAAIVQARPRAWKRFPERDGVGKG